MNIAEYQANGLTSYVGKKDILAALAYWAVRQSPYIHPAALSDALHQAANWIDANASIPAGPLAARLVDYTVMRHLVGRMINDILVIREWNLSAEEYRRGVLVDDPSRSRWSPGNVSGGASLPQDNDFIDLDALAQNVTALCLLQNYIAA